MYHSYLLPNYSREGVILSTLNFLGVCGRLAWIINPILLVRERVLYTMGSGASVACCCSLGSSSLHSFKRARYALYNNRGNYLTSDTSACSVDGSCWFKTATSLLRTVSRTCLSCTVAMDTGLLPVSTARERY